MPIYLFHVTSICRLIQIVRRKRYKPAYQNPVAADSGLNAGIVEKQLCNQCFTATGVKLLLEYYGPLAPMQSFPLPIGAVYDALPWRVVVPYGTTAGLVMTGLQFDKGVSWYDATPEAPWWLPGKALKTYWRKRKASELEAEIAGILKNRPLLTIG